MIEEIVRFNQLKCKIETEPNKLYKILSSNNSLVIPEIKMKTPTVNKFKSLANMNHVINLFNDDRIKVLSVVTDKTFFGGNIELFNQINKNLPNCLLIRKDFIIKESQIDEIENNAILLIASFLSEEQLKNFINRSFDKNNEPIVECSSVNEIDSAVKAGAKIIGINNRDLQTFKFNVDKAENLLEYCTNKYSNIRVIMMSGYQSRDEFDKLNCHGILIGTSILKDDDIQSKLNSLIFKNVQS